MRRWVLSLLVVVTLAAMASPAMARHCRRGYRHFHGPRVHHHHRHFYGGYYPRVYRRSFYAPYYRGGYGSVGVYTPGFSFRFGY